MGGPSAPGPATGKAALREQVEKGPTPGLLAYAAGTPTPPPALGWVAVGPRPTYQRIVHSTTVRPGLRGEDPEDAGVWAITCFYVRATHRRRGLVAVLTAAAVDAARAAGASAVEAYPLDPSVRRLQAAESYVGVLPAFLAAGFTQTAAPSRTRRVVRLALG